MQRSTKHRGFSLIELVIVVVIIAIIGAIALPRLSRGAAGAADSALVGNLRVIRSAIDLYATEHGGNYPSLVDLPNALTQFSNETGTTFSATKDGVTGVIFGPYLRAVPPLPVASAKGRNTFTSTPPGGGAQPADTTAGWFYDPNTGVVKPNCGDDEVDAKNTPYNNY